MIMFQVTDKPAQLLSSKRDQHGRQRMSNTFLVVAALRSMEQPMTIEQMNWALNAIMARLDGHVGNMYTNLITNGYLERVE